MNMKRVWEFLLGLYPTDYRTRFGAELSQAFENAAGERRLRGRPAFVRFALCELSGLAIGAGAEWFAKLTTDRSVRGRVLPDLRMMRPPGVSGELWFADARLNPGNDVNEAQERVTHLVGRMVSALANRDFEQARTRSFEERRERENLRRFRERRPNGN